MRPERAKQLARRAHDNPADITADIEQLVAAVNDAGTSLDAIERRRYAAKAIVRVATDATGIRTVSHRAEAVATALAEGIERRQAATPEQYGDDSETVQALAETLRLIAIGPAHTQLLSKPVFQSVNFAARSSHPGVLGSLVELIGRLAADGHAAVIARRVDLGLIESALETDEAGVHAAAATAIAWLGQADERAAVVEHVNLDLLNRALESDARDARARAATAVAKLAWADGREPVVNNVDLGLLELAFEAEDADARGNAAMAVGALARAGASAAVVDQMDLNRLDRALASDDASARGRAAKAVAWLAQEGAVEAVVDQVNLGLLNGVLDTDDVEACRRVAMAIAGLTWTRASDAVSEKVQLGRLNNALEVDDASARGHAAEALAWLARESGRAIVIDNIDLELLDRALSMDDAVALRGATLAVWGLLRAGADEAVVEHVNLQLLKYAFQSDVDDVIATATLAVAGVTQAGYNERVREWFDGERVLSALRASESVPHFAMYGLARVVDAGVFDRPAEREALSALVAYQESLEPAMFDGPDAYDPELALAFETMLRSERVHLGWTSPATVASQEATVGDSQPDGDGRTDQIQGPEGSGEETASLHSEGDRQERQVSPRVLVDAYYSVGQRRPGQLRPFQSNVRGLFRFPDPHTQQYTLEVLKELGSNGSMPVASGALSTVTSGRQQGD